MRKFNKRIGSALATAAMLAGGGSAIATVALVSSPAASAATVPVPHGPRGNWKLAWSDEFNGTTVNKSKWFVYNGKVVNQTASYGSNVTESGGYLHLKLAGKNNGAAVASAGVQGCTQPKNGYALAVGQAIEARVRFPGSGHSIYNWPAFWTVGSWGGVGDERGGEIDAAEGLGSLTVNYHWRTSSGSIGGVSVANPAGTWSNSFHTYTVVRHATSFDVYWDGVRVASHRTSDNGAKQGIIFNNSYGTYGGSFAAPTDMKVDYVRVWSPA